MCGVKFGCLGGLRLPYSITSMDLLDLSQVSPVPLKEESTMKRTSLAFTLSIAAASALLTIVGGSRSPAYSQETDCQINLDQFKLLPSGMTYERAKEIIGCEGSEPLRASRLSAIHRLDGRVAR
jgi:hypothetical protein